MEIIKKRRIVAEVTTDIVCDCCGKSCAGEIQSYNFAQLSAHWGYGSPRDTDTWECDLCEECAVKVKEFIESLGGKVRVESQYPQITSR